ncbi:MAG: hypothetical protein COB02_11900 [Candidatus Cloacimonadota bacterium]|nr:MAG: hypothetical protein COB02_11900 [Candidatus Cloacimonadota bacterium]
MFYKTLFLFIFLYNNHPKETDIVYKTIHKKNLSFTGKVIGFKSELLYAFATPYLKSFSLKTKGLVDFQIKTRVKKSQFKLPFLDPQKKYIYGVFQDKNKNGLLDLSNEPFYFSESTNNGLIVNKSNTRKVSLKIYNIDESIDIGIKVLDSNNQLLFTRQYSKSTININNLPKKCKIKIYSTQDMGDLPISLIENDLMYDLSDFSQDSFQIYWKKEWSPLKLSINFNKSKYNLMLKNLNKKDTVPLTKLHFYDLAHGEYQILMFNNKSQAQVLKAPPFFHSNSQSIDYEFTKDYYVVFNKNIHQKKCKIYKGDKLLYQGGTPSKLELLQKGKYKILLYDKLKKKIRKKSKDFVKNLEVFTFSLNKSQKNLQIESTIQTRAKRRLSIQFYNSYTKGKKEGQVIIFQKQDDSDYNELLSLTQITNTSKLGFLNTTIIGDPKKVVYFHFDFNSDFKVNDFEQEYIRGFEWKDLNQTLGLPKNNLGYLILSGNLKQKNKYFVSVTNTKTNSIIISDYFTKKEVSYQKIPIEVDLKVQVIYDKNQSEHIDDDDFSFPAIYTRVKAITQSKKLFLDLHEK